MLARLEGAGVGFDRAARTLVVSEAVLFYLAAGEGEAPRRVRRAGRRRRRLGARPRRQPRAVRPRPRAPAADAYFGDLGLELRRTLWGGAIQFVDAASRQRTRYVIEPVHTAPRKYSNLNAT